MLNEHEKLLCNVCSSDLAPGTCETDSTSKILACKHRFCKPCLKSRIRILKQDKLMVVRCPVDGCAAITAKNLPDNYKYEKDRERHRFSLTDTAQKLKQKAAVSSTKKSSRSSRKNVNCDKIVESASTRVSSYIMDNMGTRAVIQLLLRGIYKVTAAAYAVVIVAIATGLAAGFDIGYSHTLAGLANQDVQLIYALLLCVLFSVELFANFTSLKFISQSIFLGCLDTIAIALLGITAFGKLDFGYCHSLDRYLVMFSNKYMVALFVGTLVAVEAALLGIHYGTLLVNAITTGLRGPQGLIHDSPSSAQASRETMNTLSGQKNTVFSPKKDYEFTYMTPSKTQSSTDSTSAGSGGQSTPLHDTSHNSSFANSVATVDSAVFSAEPSPQSALHSVRKRVDFDLQDYSCGVTPFNSTETSATSVDDEGGCAKETGAFTGTSTGTSTSASPSPSKSSGAGKAGRGSPSSQRAGGGDDQGQGQCGSAQKNVRAAMVLAGLQTPTDDTDSDVEVHDHDGSYSSVRYKHGVLDTTPYISSTDTSIAHYASPPCSTSAAENDITLDVFTTTPCRVNGFELAASARSGAKKEFLYGTPTPSLSTHVTYKALVADAREASHTTTADDQSTLNTLGEERPHKPPLPAAQSTRSTYNDDSFQSTYNPLCAYSDNPFPATPDYNHHQHRAGNNYFESPEEEDFKLHSNIKLKPLGSWEGRVSDLMSGLSNPTECAREREEQDYQHTYLLGASNFSNPTSPAAPSSFVSASSAATTVSSSSVASRAPPISTSSAAANAVATGLQQGKASNASVYSGAVSAFGADAPSFKVSDLVSSFEKRNGVNSKGSVAAVANKGTAKICGKDCVNIVNNKIAKGSVGGKKATTATGFLGSGLSNLIR